MSTTDLADFGFKGGDTMKATLVGQPDREGIVVWIPQMGMCLEWKLGRAIFHSRLTQLHEHGWVLELVKRPLLDDHDRAMANILDDENLHFAFRDDITSPTAFTDRAMAAVGINFPVMALPAAHRETFERRAAMVAAPVRIYDGPLPVEDLS